MTTRAHLADGSTFDIDEEREAKFTHLNDQAVTRWEYVGPTPEGTVRAADGSHLVVPGAEPAAAEAEPAGTK